LAFYFHILTKTKLAGQYLVELPCSDRSRDITVCIVIRLRAWRSDIRSPTETILFSSLQSIGSLAHPGSYSR